MMTSLPAKILRGADLALLRCASLLVPGRQRGEWWREWRAELWHVRQECMPAQGVSWTAERAVAIFCLGAFQDASYLRGVPVHRRMPHAMTMGSASRCILLLMGLVAASYCIALVLPGVAVARNSSPYRDVRNLMLVRQAVSAGDSVPTISTAQYEAWKRRRQNLFDGFAFYRVVRGGISPAGIAVASSNLFELLGVPVRFAARDPQGEMPRLILSDAMWKREFGGDPQVVGRVLQVGKSTAVVSGVAPEGAWKLPGKVDGWLLVPDVAKVSDGVGFVVAHLKSSPVHARWGESWRMSAPIPDGTMADFACVSLRERTRGPEDVFLFAVFLACLALPATTSLPLGEYRVSSQKLSWSRRLRRWGFLGCKIVLLLPIAYFGSLDLAHLRMVVDPVSSEYIQLVSVFSICLFGLRWVLRDQRQRCPVCLGKLTHPARVGQPSRNFLAWNGTELICLGGHGLLHIPEIQTSWFNTQRWLYLDPSWEVLFADAGLASAGY